jgi:DNA processing protein
VTACDACLRRARLIAELRGHLDHLHAERGLLGEVFALGDEDLLEAIVPDPSARERIGERVRAAPVSRERTRAAATGLAIVCRHDAAYPPPLRDLQGPPSALFVRGGQRLAALMDPPAVAIVGARRASAYGLEMARTLGRGLAAAGLTVVSGMALGVDSAAHAGALEAGARTIAVLGGGADVAYPRAKRALHTELCERAAVVSELPAGFRPRRWTFPARNRVIAGLAAMTVVVEAGERSGALITARVAREIGRDVGAVPGQVTSPAAAGANALLRDGACFVDGAQSVLDALFGAGARSVPQERRPEELTPVLRILLDEVRHGEGSVAGLVAGRDVSQVMAALAELELRGYVRRGAGGVYVALP